MSKRGILILVAVFLMVSTAGITAWVIDNLFTILEQAAVMSLKPIKTGVDPKYIFDGIKYTSDGSTAWIFAADKSARRPVLIIAHGGYWQGGSAGSYRHIAGLAHRNGWVTVIPQIPPAYGFISRKILSEAKVKSRQHPAQIDAFIAAVRFTRENISGYGGDPSRIVFLGTGSGAHLSLLTAGRYMQEAGLVDELLGIVVFNLVADLTLADGGFREQFVDPVFAEKDLKSLSPVYFAKNINQPVLILSAEYQPPYLQVSTEKFIQSMREQMKDVKHFTLKQRSTRSLIFKIGRRHDKAQVHVLDFLAAVKAKAGSKAR